jgi:HAMP domain-containing protein
MTAQITTEETEWKPYRDAALALSAAPAGTASLKKALGYLEAHSEALLSACDAVTAGFRDIAQDATRRMKRLMLLLIALGLLFGAIVFYFAQQKIAVPLIALDKAAADITAGNFPKLEIPASRDEVGNLFRTFSKMSETINRDLEKRSATGGLLAISLEHGSMAELLGKFLDNLLALPWLAIEAKGAIYLADAGAKNLAMAAQRGMPGELNGICANLPFGHCLCG